MMSNVIIEKDVAPAAGEVLPRRGEWSFSLREYRPTCLLLDSYREFARPTKRHGWKAVRTYYRHSHNRANSGTYVLPLHEVPRIDDEEVYAALRRMLPVVWEAPR